MTELPANKRVKTSPSIQDKILARQATYFNNYKFSDFAISVGSLILPAHRITLSNNSTYFEKLFDEDDNEIETFVTSTASRKHNSEPAYWRTFEYIYTAKYSDEVADDLGVEDDDETVRDIRVYRLACFLGVLGLRKYALDRVTAKLDGICQNTQFPSAIQEIYDATSNRSDVLRRLVVSVCQKDLAKLWALDEFKALVRDGGDFVEDLINSGASIRS